MRQSPRLLQGSRAGRNEIVQPITGSLPPPQTPRHPKTGAALNALIQSLEHDWRLGLHIRGDLWSPQKSDKQSKSDKVYGQIKRLFFSARPTLDSALETFKNLAPGFTQGERLHLLHGILKSITQSPISRAGTPLSEPPKSLKSKSVNQLSRQTTYALALQYHDRNEIKPDSCYITADPGSPTDVDDDDEDGYYTPPSPTTSAIQRRAEASPRQPLLLPSSKKRRSNDSAEESSSKWMKTYRGKQHVDQAATFKKPALNMAPSFQLTNLNSLSSANTSFNEQSVFSSQETQATSANTSFMTDGASDAPPVGSGFTEAEKRNFELEKSRENDRIFSQEATRASNSTYGSINEEDLWNLNSKDAEIEYPKLPVDGRSSLENSRTSSHEGRETSGKSESALKESHNIRDIPLQNLFIDDSICDSAHAPYFVRFLCQQLIATQSVSGDVVSKILRTPSSYASSESFWAATGIVLDPDKYSTMKMGSRLWKSAQSAKSPLEGYTFKGQILFSSKRASPVFSFQPLPIQPDKSCRFQRKFGSDRFLYVTAPIFESKSTERFNGTEMEQVRLRWSQWLHNEHAFLGRKWRVFHIEPIKNNKAKNRQRDATHDKRIILFATSGIGIDHPVSIGAMLDWFLPFGRNSHQSFCKIFARFDLGLSRTVPTLVFKPSEVKYVHNIVSNGEEECTEFDDNSLQWPAAPEDQVMNDGCALISVSAAKEIWRCYKEAMGLQGAQALPSAFQGRIGGAKGMWIVSGESFSKDPKDHDRWIEINESQLKFNPHGEDSSEATYDKLRLTFEVTNYSTAPCASELHISFIPIMIDRRVPRAAIADMMTTRLNVERAELVKALTDPVRMYDWLHRNGSKSSFGDIAWQAALPVALEEKIKLMLESGFLPAENSFLANAIERFVQNKQVIKESKLRTPLGKSTFLFGVVDTLGVLKPGEIHVQFSFRFTDEVTEESYLHLKNIDLLVARQPACRRSDIQKVHAIVHPELSHLIDVVVFPSRGQFPLAGKLQGGDYDGDLFWLCWEPSLVDPFHNAPAPVQSSSPSSYGVKTDKRRLSEMMNPEELNSVDDFLKEAFKFRSNPSLLGMVTALLEKKSYCDNQVYSDQLDQLCGLHDLLVDAPKQGYTFTQADFKAYQKTALGLQKPLKQPAHKAAMDGCLGTIDIDEIEKLRLKDYCHKPDRVLDYLYFDVIRAHNRKTAQYIKSIFSRPNEAERADKTLAYPYNHLKEKGDAFITQELRRLNEQLGALYQRWNSGFHKLTTTESKNRHAEECYKAYKAIRPTHSDITEVIYWLEPYSSPDSFSWDAIKGSTLYVKYHYIPNKADFIFKMAGRELTELKARSSPRTRYMIASIHANMKPKRIKAPAELDEDNGDDNEDECEEALLQVAS
ncbi:RNA dependent RNA polymerase-domain-containing protein [Phaeosphaeria sp. MPI-PUGE-AT-0046c]|nr:RNA dependent RNA polymerase-domain-containing protein [Phaeosphaeria sp. MPI-PUGE-AT-0046c]